MSIFTKIVDFASGGIGGKIIDGIKDYFPPSMSDAEKSQLELEMTKVAHTQEIELLGLANDADREFNNRVTEMEGTAADLKSIPIIGPILILLRGLQRPVWGFATLWLDLKVFGGAWVIAEASPLGPAFIAINILVLGFLFGERAIKNVMPFLTTFFGAYNGKK